MCYAPLFVSHYYTYEVLAAFSYAYVIDNASIVRSVRFVYDCSSVHTLANRL